MLFEGINFTLCWGRRKDWFTEDWVQFDPIHCAQHISILEKLANRFVFFHVHSVSVNRVAFFILPDVWWSYLNFFRHFNILFDFVQ